MPTIRLASAADAAGIAEVHVRSWQAAYAGQLPDDFLGGLSVSDRQRRWEGVLCDPEQRDYVFVLDLGGNNIGGFVRAGPTRDEDVGDNAAELRNFYLHPCYWGCGLGRLLQDQALGKLRSDGYELVTLWVLDTNVQARRFYERTGWFLDKATKIEYSGEVAFPQVRYIMPLRSLLGE